MLTPNRVDSPRVCPRCKVVLPPDEITCYSCGFQLAQSPLAPGNGKDQSPKQNQRVCIYFVSIFLVIFLFAFLLFRAAGNSLSMYFPFLAATHSTVAYPVPNETPLFSESFLGDDNGWNLQSAPRIYSVTLGRGMMTMEIERHNVLWELIPGERTYSDFIFTVNAVLSRGNQNNGYGVYIRGTANQTSDLATYYRFELYGDGSYAIFKGMLDPSGHSTSTAIAGYTLSPIILPQGKLNHLMIVARGATVSFIVNGQLLKTISDRSYASGSIALFVSNLPQSKSSAQVQFSQLTIYPDHA